MLYNYCSDYNVYSFDHGDKINVAQAADIRYILM